MNATAPIIVMLDYSEIDMETTKSDDCREMSEDYRNFNRILATIQDRVRFKDQGAGKIKQSNIKVQIHTITSSEYYGQVNNFGNSVI